jgi:hypothetical protein
MALKGSKQCNGDKGMKTIEDLRLEMTVSDMILELVREAINGDLNEVPNGDVQGICEALAMNIIRVVKEAA